MVTLSFKKQLKLDLVLLSLIGSEIKIINSKIYNQIGISGLIVMETKNFIFLKLENNLIKKIKKSNLVFELKFKNNILIINANSLLGNIQQRIKKLK